jgi:hypothetical protein
MLMARMICFVARATFKATPICVHPLPIDVDASNGIFTFFINLGYQLTVRKPSSITVAFEKRLSMLSIALASVAVRVLPLFACFLKGKIYKFL